MVKHKNLKQKLSNKSNFFSNITFLWRINIFNLDCAIFHISLTARIYLISLPRFTSLFFLFLGFGSFSLASIIVGLSLELVSYDHGFGVTEYVNKQIFSHDLNYFFVDVFLIVKLYYMDLIFQS